MGRYMLNTIAEPKPSSARLRICSTAENRPLSPAYAAPSRLTMTVRVTNVLSSAAARAASATAMLRRALSSRVRAMAGLLPQRSDRTASKVRRQFSASRSGKKRRTRCA